MKVYVFVSLISAEASAQAKPVTTPKRNVDQTALAEVEGIFKNPGVHNKVWLITYKHIYHMF